VDNTQNLDLNTTAKKDIQGKAKLSPFLMNGTYAVVVANLLNPIGVFNLDKELHSLEVEEAAAIAQTKVASPVAAMKVKKKGSNLEINDVKEIGRHDSASKDRLGSQASGEFKSPTQHEPLGLATRSASIGS